jgi:hypothetical protein
MWKIQTRPFPEFWNRLRRCDKWFPPQLPSDSRSASSRLSYRKLNQPATREVMHLPNCHVLDQSPRGKSTLTGS